MTSADSAAAAVRAVGLVLPPGSEHVIELSPEAMRILYPLMDMQPPTFDPALHRTTYDGAPIFDAFGFPIPKSGSATLFHSTQLKSDMSGTVGFKAFPDPSGLLKIYGGGVPASADAAEATLLASITMPATMFGAFSAGQLTAGAITSGSVTTSGTATHWRLVKSGDTGALSTTQQRLQGTCGTSAADMILNSVILGAGAIFGVSSFVYTFPQ